MFECDNIPVEVAEYQGGNLFLLSNGRTGEYLEPRAIWHSFALQFPCSKVYRCQV